MGTLSVEKKPDSHHWRIVLRCLFHWRALADGNPPHGEAGSRSHGGTTGCSVTAALILLVLLQLCDACFQSSDLGLLLVDGVH